MIGAEEDRITPFSHTEAIAAELPNATLVRVPGAGHQVMLERPDIVNAELARLLKPRRKGRRS